MKAMELRCSQLLLNGLDKGLSQMFSSMGSTSVAVTVSHFVLLGGNDIIMLLRASILNN